MEKRMRVFAGPNGSGKSTIMGIVKEFCDLGVYVNADEIKTTLALEHELSFSVYNINVGKESFLRAYQMSSIIQKESELKMRYIVEDNKLIINQDDEINDYFVAFLADYIRNQLLLSGKKFSFETVMSHVSKIDFMKQAHEAGYKVYLYYVSLRDPELNVYRVSTRVANGGHDVPEEKIRKRYYSSLNLLKDAILVADNSYIFDNSSGSHKLIAEIKNNEMKIRVDYAPEWFVTYFVKKLS